MTTCTRCLLTDATVDATLRRHDEPQQCITALINVNQVLAFQKSVCQELVRVKTGDYIARAIDDMSMRNLTEASAKLDEIERHLNAGTHPDDSVAVRVELNRQRIACDHIRYFLSNATTVITELTDVTRALNTINNLLNGTTPT